MPRTASNAPRDRAGLPCVRFERRAALTGTRDNYPADEALGRRIAAIDDGALRGAPANRAFMRRATRAPAEDGITQFLDIGTGIPTRG